ncbi:MAG TPA: metal-dependent hydrolase [Pyrinomonadaceae bacterium]|jgi:inner membrane protein
MPTIFSHAIFAAAMGKACVSKPVSVQFWLLTALCAMIPDADVIGFSFGVEYGSMFGHRGFTHSILFSILFGSAVAFFARKYLRIELTLTKLIIYFSLVTFSHAFLDMLTNGGSGVALFAPFSAERYFFPWRPVEVSPIGVRFFGGRGLDVIESEIIWIWFPAFVILLSATLLRKLKKIN